MERLYNNIKKMTTSVEEKEIMKAIADGSPLYLLWGGLGNQLFGLSSAYYLHKRTGKRVFVDIANCEHLNGNEIPDSLQLREYGDWVFFIDSGGIFLKEVSKSAKSFDAATPVEFLKGAFVGWDPSLDTILESSLFPPQDSMVKNNRQDSSKSVAIHIRRGDYSRYSYLGVIPLSYYHRAVKLVNQRFPKSSFTFFSDDIDYARKISEKLGIEFVDGNRDSTLSTFESMLKFDFIVCANSTFSFWAAFLSGSPATYPYPWFVSDFNWGRKLLRPIDMEVKISIFGYKKYMIAKIALLLERIKNKIKKSGIRFGF